MVPLISHFIGRGVAFFIAWSEKELLQIMVPQSGDVTWDLSRTLWRKLGTVRLPERLYWAALERTYIQCVDRLMGMCHDSGEYLTQFSHFFLRISHFLVAVPRNPHNAVPRRS